MGGAHGIPALADSADSNERCGALYLLLTAPPVLSICRPAEDRHLRAGRFIRRQ